MLEVTPEQKDKVYELGRKLKEILFDFTGAITYHLCDKTNDVKMESKDCELIRCDKQKAKTGT